MTGGLRAWAWGAGRAFDYLAADPAVSPREIGIEGVSRFGKAALVTLAFDQRFTVGLIGSSGEGGAKPSGRNFGEATEPLGGGEYYWMAGNVMLYRAAAGRTGAHTAGDLPVDANSLIALCAPRLTFISYGNPAHGDANWLDQRGSLIASVAAQPVFRLAVTATRDTSGRFAQVEQSMEWTMKMPSGILAWCSCSHWADRGSGFCRFMETTGCSI